MLSSGWSWAGWVPTPYIRKRSPLRSIARSTRGRIPCADILHPDISQLDGRGGRFNFSGYTYPDLLITLTRRVFLSVYNVAVLSWSFLIFSTDILRYFRPTSWDIFDRHFGIFCFRYLMSKSLNSPYNPPIIGLLSL